MATTVGLIKGATEAILGIGEVRFNSNIYQLLLKISNLRYQLTISPSSCSTNGQSPCS